jgi:hypothetical protein
MRHMIMGKTRIACSVSLLALALFHVTAAAEALDSLNLDAFAPIDPGAGLP